MGDSPLPTKTVFISYSHDSEAHSQRVLELSDRLRKDGINCILDQYIDSPPESWPQWMDREIDKADAVLMVCTQIYYNRVMGKEKKGKGRGVKWEAVLTYNHLYHNDSKNTRFIPVVFRDEDERFIPMPIKGSTFYCLENDAGYEAGYEKLYRRLTGQPLVEKPELGQVRKLAPKRHTPANAPLDGSHQPPLSRGDDNRKTVRISISKLPVSSSKLFGREKELEQLNEGWRNKDINMVTIVAWGGVGKTALVNGWLMDMKKRNFDGAARVYGWSFYSQGTGEDKQAPVDIFLQEILEWFGDPQPNAGSGVQKARRLKELICREKTLLVLDGLEPQQYPPNQGHGLDGQIKDHGLKMLLKELAVCIDGLCVITTRETVTDLKSYMDSCVQVMELEKLPVKAGVALLNNLGVKGSKKELEEAVKDFDGHALALTLLGNFLSKVYEGDIRKRDLIQRLTDEEEQGAQAKRVMASYEQWLGHTPDLQILYLMGLFDRPAPFGALDALRQQPIIPMVTEALQDLTQKEWQYALNRLRQLGLLAGQTRETDSSLDCHPLVRQYFGDQLKKKFPSGWENAHARLYNYYKNLPEKEFPDTLEEMEPLYTAVAHGCAAGLHRDTLEEVYWNRIKREDQHFSTKKLGAFGSDLAALSHFFHPPWTHPAKGLSDHWKAGVLNWAGFRLRALGRLYEAVEPFEAVLELKETQKSWSVAAACAGNLSELLLTLGRVPQAVAAARRAVDHADKSKDDFEMESNRTALADSLHQWGKFNEAEQAFKEAEDKQKARLPQYPYLYSLQGYQYCDLLLGRGQYPEVMERAKTTLEWVTTQNWLLDIAMEHLSLGRATLMKAQETDNAGDWQEAGRLLDRAVEGLRDAGTQDHLPRGLFARARYYRLRRCHSIAWADLNEAFEIISLGHMNLYLPDYHLEKARLLMAEEKKEDAAEQVKRAEKQMNEMECFRWKEDVARLQ